MWMNLEDITLSETSQSQKHKYCKILLILRVVKIRETEGRMVVVRGRGQGGLESYCFMSIGFQFYKMERAVEMDGGDGCTTL